MDSTEVILETGSTSTPRPQGEGLVHGGWNCRPNTVHLGIGELVVSREGVPLVTVLGSCLALVIGAPAHQIYGMVHAIYPSRNQGLSGATRSEGLFVDEGFRALFRQFNTLGLDASQLTFKLFGGASMMARPLAYGNFPSAGEANLVVARATLAYMGATLQAEDVGGFRARKIIVDPNSGLVSVRFLGSVNDPAVALN